MQFCGCVLLHPRLRTGADCCRSSAHCTASGLGRCRHVGRHVALQLGGCFALGSPYGFGKPWCVFLLVVLLFAAVWGLVDVLVRVYMLLLPCVILSALRQARWPFLQAEHEHAEFLTRIRFGIQHNARSNGCR